MRMSRPVVWLCASTLVVQFGCALAPRKPFGPPDPSYVKEQDRIPIKRVAVVAARFEPEVDTQMGPPGTGGAAPKTVATGVAGGGVVGILACALFTGGSFGPWGPIVPTCAQMMALSLAHGAAAGTTLAGVEGAWSAPHTQPGQETVSPETVAKETLRQLGVQQEVRSRAVRYGNKSTFATFSEVRGVGPDAVASVPDYVSTARQGVDAVLEIRVLGLHTVRLEAFGIGFALRITAGARLMRASDGSILSDQVYHAYSESRPYHEWARDGGRAFRAALYQVQDELAEQIVDELFLLYSLRSAHALADLAPEERGREFRRYVLAPEYPNLGICVFCGPRNFAGLPFSAVDSLQPEFRWERFPRSGELGAGEMGPAPSVTSVSYELRVYRSNRYFKHTYVQIVPVGTIPVPLWETLDVWNAASMVHERTGITQPHHRLELPLEPCTRYQWTVRARYALDGMPRVTEWAGAFPPDRAPWTLRHHHAPETIDTRLKGLAISPSAYYYPFMTPAAQASGTCPEP